MRLMRMNHSFCRPPTQVQPLDSSTHHPLSSVHVLWDPCLLYVHLLHSRIARISRGCLGRMMKSILCRTANNAVALPVPGLYPPVRSEHQVPGPSRSRTQRLKSRRAPFKNGLSPHHRRPSWSSRLYNRSLALRARDRISPTCLLPRWCQYVSADLPVHPSARTRLSRPSQLARSAHGPFSMTCHHPLSMVLPR